MRQRCVLLRRWRPPFGSATVIFTTFARGLRAMEALEGVEMVLSAVIGGLATDLLIRYMKPSYERPWTVRAVAALAPGFLWLSNFVIIDVAWGIAWTVHLWTGTVCLAMLAGFACSLAAGRDRRTV